MNKIRFLLFGCPFAYLLLLPLLARAENPHWIWHDNHGTPIKTNEFCFLRKTFLVGSIPAKAVLRVAADDEAIVFLNGKEIARPKDYAKPASEDVTARIKKGRNVIAIRGQNLASDQAGVLATLELQVTRKNADFVVTDNTWLSSRKEKKGWETVNFDDTGWSKAVSRGKLGDKPWGDVLEVPMATAADSLTVLPGFKVELLRSSEIGEGSWICMAIDQKGRLIISPQADNQPLLREAEALIAASQPGKIGE